MWPLLQQETETSSNDCLCEHVLHTNRPPKRDRSEGIQLIFGFFEILNFGRVEIVDMALKLLIVRQNFEFSKVGSFFG